MLFFMFIFIAYKFLQNISCVSHSALSLHFFFHVWKASIIVFLILTSSTLLFYTILAFSILAFNLISQAYAPRMGQTVDVFNCK